MTESLSIQKIDGELGILLSEEMLAHLNPSDGETLCLKFLDNNVVELSGGRNEPINE